MRRRRLTMPEKFPDHRQPHRCTGADAGERMTQIMKSDSFEASRLAYSGPRPFQIGPRRAVLRPSDDMWIALDARERRKYQKRRRREIDRLLASLAIRQKNHPTLNVNMLPIGVENFAKASAG